MALHYDAYDEQFYSFGAYIVSLYKIINLLMYNLIRRRLLLDGAIVEKFFMAL